MPIYLKVILVFALFGAIVYYFGPSDKCKCFEEQDPKE